MCQQCRQAKGGEAVHQRLARARQACVKAGMDPARPRPLPTLTRFTASDEVLVNELLAAKEVFEKHHDAYVFGQLNGVEFGPGTYVHVTERE